MSTYPQELTRTTLTTKSYIGTLLAFNPHAAKNIILLDCLRSLKFETGILSGSNRAVYFCTRQTHSFVLEYRLISNVM